MARDQQARHVDATDAATDVVSREHRLPEELLAAPDFDCRLCFGRPARCNEPHLVALLIGNTAERILDELSCDVLVVKPSKFRTRVPRSVRGPQWLVSPPMPMAGSY